MTFGDLTFHNLVLWNDVPGNGVEIGHTSQADRLSNVLFEKIYVVHADGGDGGKHVISVFLVDHCNVEDITYRDFFVEGYHKDQPVLPMLISDYDQEHKVQDVTLHHVGQVSVDGN